MNSIYSGSGGLTREQFLFFEIRTAASLFVQGMQREEIIKKIVDENLFQFPTERMSRSIANACFRRMDALGSDGLIRLLASAPLDTAKQVNLYAMMKYNHLMWDFMTTVIGEKYRTQEAAFSKKDVNVFFFRLFEQDETVAAWSDGTVTKIKQVLIRSLVECGYLDSARSENLNPIVIAPELEDAIRAAGDLAALPAFNCFC